MKLLGYVFAVVCCSASVAKANWEYTKWGMTPQQVASAAKNSTRKNPNLHPDSDGNVTKLVAPYKSGRLSFEAQFGFDAADRLSSVTLVLNDKSARMDMGMSPDMNMGMDQGKCHDLQMSVKAAHGPPQGGGAAHMHYTIQTWRDQKNRNNVAYAVLYGVGCYVQYSAIKPAGARRL